MIKVNTVNGTTYTKHTVTIVKSIYTVLVVTGNNNYVTIRKETANPHKTMGKQFKNFDEAVRNYKNANMKTALLKIELGLN